MHLRKNGLLYCQDIIMDRGGAYTLGATFLIVSFPFKTEASDRCAKINYVTGFVKRDLVDKLSSAAIRIPYMF